MLQHFWDDLKQVCRLLFGGLSVVWSLEVLIVSISEVEMYKMYAMIIFGREVCPFYGDCPLPAGSVT